MIPLAMFAVLMNSTISVPKSHWNAVDVKVKEPGTVVECEFTVANGGRVEAIFTTRADAERFNRGRSYRPLYSTGYQTSAHFRYDVETAGDYILLFDNRLEARWDTPVSVTIELWNSASVHPITVPPQRRFAIIVLSLLFFVAIVMFSARQFIR